MELSISIVGAGRTGRTLGRLFQRAGIPIRQVAGRSLDRARAAAVFIGDGQAVEGPGGDAAVVFLCVPDGAIAEVAATLTVGPDTVVAHTAGVAGVEVLSKLTSHTGTFHPLKSFSDPERAAASFAGTAVAIEGDGTAVKRLRDIALRIGGVPLVVAPGMKPLYHAGAVFASNYVVAVFDAAVRLLEKAGIPREAAQQGLIKLTEGTVENLKAQGTPAALTGPIERGDVESVKRHVEALVTTMPELMEAYTALARLTGGAAFRKGSIDAAVAGKINAVLGSGSTGMPLERPR